MTSSDGSGLKYRVTVEPCPATFQWGDPKPDPFIPDRFRRYVENMYSFYPLDALIAVSEWVWDNGGPWDKYRSQLEQRAVHAIISKELESPDKRPPYRCLPYVYFRWFRRMHAIKAIEWTKILLDAFENADPSRHRPQTAYNPDQQDLLIIRAIGKKGGLTGPELSNKTGIPDGGRLRDKLRRLRNQGVFLPKGRKGTGYIVSRDYHCWIDYEGT